MKTHAWRTIAGLNAVFFAVVAHAETNIWVGTGGDVFWSTPGNWTGDTPPVSASDLIVRLAGNTNLGSDAIPLNQDIANPPLDLNRFETEDVSSPDGQIFVDGGGFNFVSHGDIQPSFYHARDANIFIKSPFTIPAATTLNISNRTYVAYLDGVISGDGALCFTTSGGGGELHLRNAANDYAGGTFYFCQNSGNLQWMRLRVSASGALGAGPVSLYGGNKAVLGNNGNAQAAGLTFQGHTEHANDFTLMTDAPIFVGEGLSNATVTAASVTLNGNIDLDAHTLYLRGQGNTAGTVNGVIAGTGAAAVVKMDLGTWTLAGANTFTGRVTVANGTLTLGATDTLDPTAPLTASGGTLDLGGRAVVSGAVMIDGGAISNGTLQASLVDIMNGSMAHASLAGTGGLVKNGTGTALLSATNTYTGTTTINSGILQFAKRTALYDGDTAQWTPANIIVNNGATLALNAGGSGEFAASDLDVINALGAISGGFQSGSFWGIDTTFAPDGIFAYGSVIGDPNGHTRGLTKLGEGTLELGDFNTYTGPTRINEGILSIAKLDNGGYASGIGASLSNAASLVFNGGALRYTGATVSTDRLFTFGTGNTAIFDVAQPDTTLAFTQIRACIGRNDNSVIVKNGPGTLSLGNDGFPGGAQAYIGNIAAFELNEGVYLTPSTDVAQLNLVRKAPQGPALILGDGVRMEFDPPLSVSANGDEQVVRYIGTNRMATTKIGSLQGPETAGQWNTKTFDVNDGDADIDLQVINNMTVYPDANTPRSRIRKDGAGTLKFLGTASRYRETTIVRAGRLLIGANVPSGKESVLGLCAADVIIGDEGTQVTDTPTLLFDGPAGSTFTFERGLATWTETGTSTFGSLSNVNVILSGSVTVSNTLRLVSSGTGANSLSVTGGIAGPGGVTASGAGTVLFASANTYTGATSVEAGTLRLGVAGSIADTSALQMAGGTLDLNGFSETVGTLDLDGAAEITFNGGTLTCAATAGNWDGTLVLRDWQRGATPLFIGTAATLTDAQLAKITSPTGQKAGQLPNGEIILIPPGTVLTVQ